MPALFNVFRNSLFNEGEYLGNEYMGSDEKSTDAAREESSGFPHLGGSHALALGLLTGVIGRQGGLHQRVSGWFALKPPALVAIGQSHLDRGQHSALEAHHAASVGFGRVPTDFEINTLPTIGARSTDLIEDGNVVRHTSKHGVVVDQS